VDIQGASIKNALAKIRYLCNCSRFKKYKFTAFTEKDSGDVCSSFITMSILIYKLHLFKPKSTFF